jgi:hypothetical protein
MDICVGSDGGVSAPRPVTVKVTMAQLRPFVAPVLMLVLFAFIEVMAHTHAAPTSDAVMCRKP